MNIVDGIQDENGGPPRKKAKIEKVLNKRKRLKEPSELNGDSDLPKRKRKKVESDDKTSINPLPKNARTEMKNRAAEIIAEESTQTANKITSKPVVTN